MGLATLTTLARPCGWVLGGSWDPRNPTLRIFFHGRRALLIWPRPMHVEVSSGLVTPFFLRCVQHLKKLNIIGACRAKQIHFLRNLVWDLFGMSLGCHCHTQTFLNKNKTFDDGFRGAVVQADIRTYYDKMPRTRIFNWLCSYERLGGLAATALRFHLRTAVTLCIGQVRIPADGRSVGSLTGSRSAAALGRIPVEECFAALSPSWRSCGCQAVSVLTAASYVDNLYAVGHSLHGAASIMDSLLARLEQWWAL